MTRAAESPTLRSPVTVHENAEVTLRRITALNVVDVCELSATLTEEQSSMVADNGRSIAEGYCSERAWFRAVYADETLVGFVMVHIGSDWDDGIECPGAYLWRLMIAGPYQGMTFGRRTVDLVVADLRAQGMRELFTSFGEGPGSPEPFYRALGFTRTGDCYGDEPEAVLTFGENA